MTRNQMIARVSKVIREGGKTTLIAGTKDICDIVQIECGSVIDPHGEQEAVLICRYYDDSEESNPFNNGEFAYFPTWMLPCNIVDALCAMSVK